MSTASTSGVAPTLDLRSVSAADRFDRVLARFDRMNPGEMLVLLGADPDGEILRRLQTERRGLFEWSPAAGRVEIVRRAEASTFRGVTEALSWDHDRLDALEDAAFAHRAEGDFPMACALYEEFAAGLRRHIGFEEEILFPAFEQRTGIPPGAGPTAVMRVEHREIEDLLRRICAGMADADAPAEALRRRFHAVLGDHNFKEERVLYPRTDRLLGDEKSDELVARIQRFRG